MSPTLIFIAALFAITVPLMVVPAAMLIKPSTFQNTLHAIAPLINLIFEFAAAENGPCNLKINTALPFPCASNVRVPFKVVAPDMEYTPELRICPFPSKGAGKKAGTALFNRL